MTLPGGSHAWHAAENPIATVRFITVPGKGYVSQESQHFLPSPTWGAVDFAQRIAELRA